MSTYGIRVNTHFHAGAFGAPKSRDWLRDDYGVPILFSSRQEAQEIADECAPSGTYYLSHGEYAAPEYKVSACYAKGRVVSPAVAARILELNSATKLEEDCCEYEEEDEEQP